MGNRADGRAVRARPGRAPGASREAVLAAAKASYFAGERVDVQAIARELGLGRVTMYRWFQTREGLLGEAIGEICEEQLLRLRKQTRRRGAAGLLEIFDRFNKEAAATEGLRALLEQDKERALRMLSSASGLVQPRIVAVVQRLMEQEQQAGRFVPAVAPELLALGIVRLGEAFLYNDMVLGRRGDTEQLREMDAVLLGLRGGDGPATVRAKLGVDRAVAVKPSRVAGEKRARTAASRAPRKTTLKPSRAPAGNGKLTRSSVRKSSVARSS